VSKVREKALEQAITQAVALRRKIVDCRFDRWEESGLLDKATDLMSQLERKQEEMLAPQAQEEPKQEEVANVN
jgi:hypothetical protein